MTDIITIANIEFLSIFDVSKRERGKLLDSKSWTETGAGSPKVIFNGGQRIVIRGLIDINDLNDDRCT